MALQKKCVFKFLKIYVFYFFALFSNWYHVLIQPFYQKKLILHFQASFPWTFFFVFYAKLKNVPKSKKYPTKTKYGLANNIYPRWLDIVPTILTPGRWPYGYWPSGLSSLEALASIVQVGFIWYAFQELWIHLNVNCMWNCLSPLFEVQIKKKKTFLVNIILPHLKCKTCSEGDIWKISRRIIMNLKNQGPYRSQFF